MLSICTQTAITLLHDIASGNVVQSANILFSEEEWKDLFDKLEQGRLIRRLPDNPVFIYPVASSVGNFPA